MVVQFAVVGEHQYGSAVCRGRRENAEGWFKFVLR